jgi:hypothetical protein
MFIIKIVPAETHADLDAAITGIMEMVRQFCRVRVDEVQVVPSDAIPEGAPIMLDERSWE